MRVFAYGSLATIERQKILCNRTFPMRRCRLPGYRLDEPPGCYRMIYPDPAHTVDGIIVEDVDEEALKVFDDWEVEGTLYRRVEVKVELEDGTRLDAWAYEGFGHEIPKPGEEYSIRYKGDKK